MAKKRNELKKGMAVANTLMFSMMSLSGTAQALSVSDINSLQYSQSDNALMGQYALSQLVPNAGVGANSLLAALPPDEEVVTVIDPNFGNSNTPCDTSNTACNSSPDDNVGGSVSNTPGGGGSSGSSGGGAAAPSCSNSGRGCWSEFVRNGFKL